MRLEYVETSGSRTSTYLCSKIPLSDDVWQLDGLKFFVTDSGCPHVGGPLLVGSYLLYSYDGTKLTVYMYSWDKSTWFKYGSTTKVEMRVTPLPVAPSTPSPPTFAPSTPGPLTVAPSTPRPLTVAPTPSATLTASDWQAAPEHRKCYYVWAKTASARPLEGWYSYRKTSSDTMWYWYKAAYDTLPEARLHRTRTYNKNIETVTATASAGASASFTCHLAGLTGQNDAIGVSCYLRQKGGWSAATSLSFMLTYTSTYSDTCSKVPLSVYSYSSNSFVQAPMDDVWQVNGNPNLFVTDSGRTHVGGPLLPNYVLYAYDGTKLTVHMTSSDKTNWFFYGTSAKAQMSVTP